MADLEVFSTHLKTCDCGGRLAAAHTVDAVVYIHVQTMRCTSYACRNSFGPNFVWEDSAKYNTVNSDTMGRILFVNNKCGFATEMWICYGLLAHHALLEFRAFVATRAVKDVCQEVFGISHSDKSSQFLVNHATGIMYWIAVHELEACGTAGAREVRQRAPSLGQAQSRQTSQAIRVRLVHVGASEESSDPWARAMEAPEGNDILETALPKTLPKYPSVLSSLPPCCFGPSCQPRYANLVQLGAVITQT